MTLKGKLKRQWLLHIMLIPGLIVIIIFNYVPLYGLIIAFQNYNPILGFSSNWIGWDNFRFLFNQPNFIQTIWNTLYIAFFKIVGGIIVPVVFALLLNEVRLRGVKRSIQTLVYLPYFMSWVILAGVFIDLLSLEGIANTALAALGLDKVAFLTTPRVFPWVVIVTDIWKNFGFSMVVYLAALTGIDPGLYEAATVDGATRWRQTISITIPLLLPIVILITVLSLGSVMDAGFDQIYNMYAPVVYSTGDIIDTYVFRLGIQQTQYSIGAAVGMFKSVIAFILISLSYFMADKFAGYRVF